MSTIKYKEPFSIVEFIITVMFSTYFLTVETIELSLSIYATQENKPEVYRAYLVFRMDAPIWKWWQLLLTMIILPISLIMVIKDLVEIFTKKATFKRNLIDILAAFQLFGVLYFIFVRVLPLETELIKVQSYDIVHELCSIHWILIILNIIGWFIPIFRYKDWKNDKNIHPKQKTK